MKTFVIVLLSATLIFALPIEDSSESYEESEDGWFVPQADGSLVWMSIKEAEIASRKMGRFGWGQKLKVEFYLYTQENPDVPQQIFIDDAKTLRKSNFNRDHQTRFIIHGWQNDYESEVNVEIRSALLDVMECNIISVDWSQKSKSYNYMSAKGNVPKVGEKVAEMIDFLAIEGDMSLDDLKVIGHSLGAHVSGFAGKHVTTGTIHTIIGLDPAWPLYLIAGCENRLCDTDAQYVESIHTNGGLLGFLHPIGKADFYPAGGMLQPGCGWDIGGMCSHSRSYLYFAESIRGNHFTSQKCSHWSFAISKSCNGKGTSSSLVQLGSGENYKKAKGYFFTPVSAEAPYVMV